MLDAFSLLSASTAGILKTTLSQLGGIVSILTRGKSEKIEFSIGMEIPGYEPLEYKLCIAPQGTGYSIILETLGQRRPRYKDPFMHIDSSDRNIHYFKQKKRE